MSTILIIDIGTNSILSLHAELKDQKLHVLKEQLYSPRLGEAFQKSKKISEHATQKAIAALNEIMNYHANDQIQHIVAVGTQIFRRAENAESVLKKIKKETGLDIQVLEPDQEAFWGFQGAIADLPLHQNYMTLDIGGGSTEMTIGNSQQIIQSVSLEMGAVQVKNQFFLNAPVNVEKQSEALLWIRHQFDSAITTEFTSCESIIGIGGTLTTLAAMAQNLRKYVPNKIHHYILSDKVIKNLLAKMQILSDDALKHWLRFDPQRSDIIYSGTLILACCMDVFNWQQIQVNNHGLRYGLAHSVLKKGSF